MVSNDHIYEVHVSITIHSQKLINTVYLDPYSSPVFTQAFSNSSHYIFYYYLCIHSNIAHLYLRMWYKVLMLPNVPTRKCPLKYSRLAGEPSHFLIFSKTGFAAGLIFPPDLWFLMREKKHLITFTHLSHMCKHSSQVNTHSHFCIHTPPCDSSVDVFITSMHVS